MTQVRSAAPLPSHFSGTARVVGVAALGGVSSSCMVHAPHRQPETLQVAAASRAGYSGCIARCSWWSFCAAAEAPSSGGHACPTTGRGAARSWAGHIAAGGGRTVQAKLSSPPLRRRACTADATGAIDPALLAHLAVRSQPIVALDPRAAITIAAACQTAERAGEARPLSGALQGRGPPCRPSPGCW